MIVLDTSALAAFLLREPGHEMIAAHLGAACISTVNMVEVYGRMAREGIQPRALGVRLDGLGLEVVAFDPAQAVIAGDLREFARANGVSLGDCCCLALAINRVLPVLTGDRAWQRLGFGLEVRLFR